MRYIFFYDDLSEQAQEMAEHHVISEFGLSDPEDSKYDIYDYCRCFLYDKCGFPIAKDIVDRQSFLIDEIEDSIGRLARTGDMDHAIDIHIWVKKLKKTVKVAALNGPMK